MHRFASQRWITTYVWVLLYIPSIAKHTYQQRSPQLDCLNSDDISRKLLESGCVRDCFHLPCFAPLSVFRSLYDEVYQSVYHSHSFWASNRALSGAHLTDLAQFSDMFLWVRFGRVRCCLTLQIHRCAFCSSSEVQSGPDYLAVMSFQTWRGQARHLWLEWPYLYCVGWRIDHFNSPTL